MQEPRLRQVRGDGITLQLAEWPGAGHTIVCLHGLSANCRWWDTVASGLGACPRKKSLKNNVLELRRGDLKISPFPETRVLTGDQNFLIFSKNT